jgi:diguanylate cyclase (GGDEF)-like protein
MDRPAQTVEERLRTLREEYEAQLPDRIARIVDAAETWLRSPSDSQALGVVHRMAHSLVGSSGSYGFGAISQAARALEQELKSVIEGWTPTSVEQHEKIRAAVAVLADGRLSAKGPPSAAPPMAPPGRSQIAQPGRRVPVESRLVYLWEPNDRLARDLAEQLAHFGYKVRTPDDLAALSAIVHDAPPAAIVIDAGAAEAEPETLAALAAIQQGRDVPVPAVLISSREDMEARLSAVRAGASAYITKPVDVDELVDRLDILTTRDAKEPFRVLVVDDSPELAEYLASHLHQAGMLTAVVTDPMQVMGPLTELNPDLILMDVYMPGCTGLELAAVIRQQKDYLSTPIMFLSAETDPVTQMEALRLGGDDFLTKPVQISHLISSVASRTLRSRTLRALMIRDSLTGLLNHTATEERLAAEVARAQRYRRPLAYALIDLDSFKKVNDTYGHATGDRVLTSLARLLQQRLRRSDVIGRVGGEEFVIIFTDTDGPTAVRVLNEIRERFSFVRHSAAGLDFYVTLSGGIAGYPEHADPVSLNDAADRALYESKRLGRNRVVLAP